MSWPIQSPQSKKWNAPSQGDHLWAACSTASRSLPRIPVLVFQNSRSVQGEGGGSNCVPSLLQDRSEPPDPTKFSPRFQLAPDHPECADSNCFFSQSHSHLMKGTRPGPSLWEPEGSSSDHEGGIPPIVMTVDPAFGASIAEESPQRRTMDPAAPRSPSPVQLGECDKSEIKVLRGPSPWWGRPLSSTLVLQCLLIFALFAFGYVQAVAECMSGNNLKCFECNSHTDPHCGDPFNWTTLPPRKPCDGCCVKMVQGIGTPSLSVLRTCTSELRINFFMVDHVCMAQSNRKGQLCFCEDDLCNQARPAATPFYPSLTLLPLLLLMLLQPALVQVGPIGGVLGRSHAS